MKYAVKEFWLMFQKDDFKLFEHGWTAGEDLKLIQAISDCGVGNW